MSSPSLYLQLSYLSAQGEAVTLQPNTDPSLAHRYTPAQREQILKQSGLPRPRKTGFASAAGLMIAKHALSQLATEAEPLDALFCNGGNLHCDNTWNFLHTLLTEGSEYVSAIAFPHTLVSSVPANVARYTGAQQAAITVGQDPLAFLEGLTIAARWLSIGWAKSILLLCLNDASPTLQKALTSGRSTNLPLADVALAAWLGTTPPRTSHLRLLDFNTQTENKNNTLETIIYSYNQQSAAEITTPTPKSHLKSHTLVTANSGIALSESAAQTGHGSTPFTLDYTYKKKRSSCTLCWESVYPA